MLRWVLLLMLFLVPINSIISPVEAQTIEPNYQLDCDSEISLYVHSDLWDDGPSQDFICEIQNFEPYPIEFSINIAIDHLDIDHPTSILVNGLEANYFIGEIIAYEGYRAVKLEMTVTIEVISIAGIPYESGSSESDDVNVEVLQYPGHSITSTTTEGKMFDLTSKSTFELEFAITNTGNGLDNLRLTPIVISEQLTEVCGDDLNEPFQYSSQRGQNHSRNKFVVTDIHLMPGESSTHIWAVTVRNDVVECWMEKSDNLTFEGIFYIRVDGNQAYATNYDYSKFVAGGDKIEFNFQVTVEKQNSLIDSATPGFGFAYALLSVTVAFFIRPNRN